MTAVVTPQPPPQVKSAIAAIPEDSWTPIVWVDEDVAMRIAVAGGTGVVGRHAVAAARRAGHDVAVLSRDNGVDLRRDEGVAQALDGVEAIVDTTNVVTTNGEKARAFFVDVTARLQRIGADRNVRHVVTLSIVGIDRATGYGYYAAKLAQEKQALAGEVPTTIVRATQFFEFPGQLLRQFTYGPVAVMPQMKVQPVAARAVGEALATVAAQPPDGRVEVAGPDQTRLADMARRLLRARRSRTLVVAVPVPGRAGSAMRRGALLPGDDALIVGPTFGEWLAAGELGAQDAAD